MPGSMLMTLLLAVAQSSGASGYDVKRADVSLHVRESGQGTTIIVLAGGPGLNAAYLEPLSAELTRDHRCVVPDQRGTGLSKLERLDATTLNLAAYVADLEAVREHLRQPALVIVGHSWGGMLAMAYAAAHPDRVQRLVLVGSGGPTTRFLESFNDNIEMRLWPEDREMLAAAKGKPDAAERSLRARMPGYFFSHEEGLKARALVGPDTVIPGIGPIVIGGLAAGYDLTAALRALQVPALILQGRQDPIGESTALEIHDAIPGSKIVWLERCGHFPWIEAKDRFFAELRSFLDGK